MNESSYIAVDVTLPAGLSSDDERVDILSAEIFGVGAVGLETKDDDDPVVLVASFEATDLETHRALVESALVEAGIDGATVKPRPLEAIDWSEHWKQHFVPLQFGDLWVVPTWLEAPAEAGSVLWIDPSSAFGTGQHVSTGSCLDRIVELSPKTDVLDVGTGTGILALAALLRGAPRAVAIDNDPEAVVVTKENAEKNDLVDRIDVSTTPLDQIEGTFDFVVANILAGPLIAMAPALAARVAPGGHLAMSGILGTQGEDVAAAYVAAGLELVAIVPYAEWVRVDLVRS